MSGWQHRGMRADEVGAEQQPGVWVREHLHEAGGVLERPAVGRVTIAPGGRRIPPSLCLELMLGRARAGDLRVGEHRGRDDGEVHPARLVRVQQVVPDQPGLGVGHVLELGVVREVPQRPDSRHVRGTGVVGPDVPVGVDVDPRRRDLEAIAVRRPPGRDQQHLGFGAPRACGRQQVEADSGAAPADPLDGCAEQQVETLRVDLGEPLAHIEVVPGEQVRAARDDGDAESSRMMVSEVW